MQLHRYKNSLRSMRALPVLLMLLIMKTYSQDTTKVNTLNVNQSAEVYSPLLLRSVPAWTPDYYSFVKIKNDSISLGEIIPAARNNMVLTRTSFSLYNTGLKTNSVLIEQNQIVLKKNLTGASPKTIIKQGTAEFLDTNNNQTAISNSTITSTSANLRTTINGPSIEQGTVGLSPSVTIAGGTLTTHMFYGATVTGAEVNGTHYNTSTVNGNNVNVSTSFTTPYMKLSKLDVPDTLKSTKINSQDINLFANIWPDYVFKPEYKLQPLGEVKTYIEKNGRLPGIPSESEVTQNGLSVGEMNVKLLEKIEEMTLHMIQLQARITELEAQDE